VDWLVVLGAVVAALLVAAWAFDRWRAALPPERRRVDTGQIIRERRQALRARSPVRRYVRGKFGHPDHTEHPGRPDQRARGSPLPGPGDPRGRENGPPRPPATL